MSPLSLYKQRHEHFLSLAGDLQVKENRLAMGRLVTFVFAIVTFIAFWRISHMISILISLSCMAVFAFLVRQYAAVERKKHYNQHLAAINELEMRAVSGDHKGFGEGAEYIDREHPNSYDLDLFGSSSVFQFLNRTISLPGHRLLAEWLKHPAGKEEIPLRQEAVVELSPQIDWRQDLMTRGYFTREAMNDPGDLLRWMKLENEFKNTRQLRISMMIMTGVMLAMVILAIMGFPAVSLLPFVLLNGWFYLKHHKSIQRIHSLVGRSARLMEAYGEIISSIEAREFTCVKLRQLQKLFLTTENASVAVSRLSKQVEILDSRLNILVAIPLNLVFFRDIYSCLALEKWKNRHSGKIRQWLDVMAEFEGLNCLANTHFNNPQWAMPEIVPGFFTFKAEKMGHMLIPSEKRIVNDIAISGGNRMILVTGSNMSGKSTFLRTCGVNAILALAGSPVCASRLTLSHVSIYSSMRISDSLEDNTSSFYAELKRLSAMIHTAEKDPRVFLLLDEILRGTNSNDRYTGSVALIRQLSSYGTVAIVATHDLKLAGLEKEMPEVIENYHFDVKVEGEELYFDFKLTPGVCTSLNASILMKKMGIRIGMRDEG